MLPKIIFFDCAQTLIRVRWQIGQFAVESAESLKMHLRPNADHRYLAMFQSRLGLFHEANMSKNAEIVRTFWLALNQDWLREEGQNPDNAAELTQVSDDRLFHKDSTVFQPYDDVVPCLSQLKEQGILMGVISNWDMSLHRVLAMFDLSRFFEVVVASLEEGIEKPDPRLFHLALARSGQNPSEAMHIGDDALDDLQGAQGAGLQAALIDRSRTDNIKPFLSSLNNIQTAIDWFGNDKGKPKLGTVTP